MKITIATITLVLALSLAAVASAQEAEAAPAPEAAPEEQAEVTAPTADADVQTAPEIAEEKTEAANEAPVVTSEELSTGTSVEEQSLESAEVSGETLLVSPDAAATFDQPDQSLADVDAQLEQNSGIETGATEDASADIFSDEA